MNDRRHYCIHLAVLGLVAGLAWGDEQPQAWPDAMLMRHQTKAGIPVLRNDTGNFDTSTVAVVTAPLYGTALPQAGGAILYTHVIGVPDTDSFTYTVADFSGNTSAPTLVNLQFSTDPRLPNTTATMPSDAPPALYTIVEAFPGLAFPAPTSMASPPGDHKRLFIGTRGGSVHVIHDVSAVPPVASLFLDISSRVLDDSNERGMKGIEFHPDFASNGYFYVTYNTFTNGVTHVRLSRFEVFPNNPNAADPASERMLIDQRNDDVIHNINDPVFGPDGYLYLGFGDEGPQYDGGQNSQRIDKDIWSALIRIDVDKLPGNLPPNPHDAIVTNGLGEANFAIPADNPFIGATQFNGIAVDPAQVRTEFYAVGFRNPWQFSFDPLTGDIWLGDVGLSEWEEVNVVRAGGNYGWAYFEGTHAGPRTPPAGFSYDAPVWEYPHGSGPYSGNCIIGGVFYRGTRYPELDGKFICGDLASANIWSIQRTDDATNVERIARLKLVDQYGLDPATGDILLLGYNNGRVQRMLARGDAPVLPPTLSQTGLFADLTDLSPNPGVEAYTPNLDFWSDYAHKRRWFVIPNLTNRVTYAREESWGLPAGTMWVKHFDLELTRGVPESAMRLETRVLVRTTNSVYGVSYRWNEAGTEAFLVPDEGLDLDLAITNQAGLPATQRWRIPSRTECLSCHDAAGGYALSFNTRQLNRDGALGGLTGNFLNLLQQAGYVANTVDPPATLPRHIRPDETSYSLDARVRSFLAVNCAYCHQPANGLDPATWDGRPHLTLQGTRLVNGVPRDDGGNPANRLIVPGDALHSIVYNRMGATNGFTRMPPLASNEIDPVNLQLVSDWIAQTLPSWQSYDAWRLAHFGSTNSSDGEFSADPDADGSGNEQEFLTFTDPNLSDRPWFGDFMVTNDSVVIHQDLPARHVFVEASTNLFGWSTWDAADNNGLALATGTVSTIAGPAPGNPSYFRFRIEEN